MQLAPEIASNELIREINDVYSQFDLVGDRELLKQAMQVVPMMQDPAFAKYAADVGMTLNDDPRKILAVKEEYDATIGAAHRYAKIEEGRRLTAAIIKQNKLNAAQLSYAEKALYRAADIAQFNAATAIEASAPVIAKVGEVAKTVSEVSGDVLETLKERGESRDYLEKQPLEPIEVNGKKVLAGGLAAGILLSGGQFKTIAKSSEHVAKPRHTLSQTVVAESPLITLIGNSSAQTIETPSKKAAAQHPGSEKQAVAGSQRTALINQAKTYAHKLMAEAQAAALKQETADQATRRQHQQTALVVHAVDSFVQASMQKLIKDPTIELTPDNITAAANSLAVAQIATRYPQTIQETQLTDFQKSNAHLFAKALFGSHTEEYSGAEQLTIANAVAGAAENLIPADQLTSYVLTLEATDSAVPVLPVLPENEASADATTNSSPTTPSEIAPKHLNIEKLLTDNVISGILPNAKAANIAEFTPLLFQALHEAQIDDAPMVAYAFGTINAETSAFAPIPEYASGREYEGRTDLGNTEPGDGERFKGRGFIQLTGRHNYRLMGQKLGVDLENNPDLALRPDVAVRIFANFLAPRADSIRHALASGDLAQARRYVNGGTNGLEKMSASYTAAMNILDPSATPIGGVETAVPAVQNPDTSGFTTAAGETFTPNPNVMKSIRGVTMYSQHDSRWANKMFSIMGNPNQDIETSGCGPTSLAISVSTLSGQIVSPDEMAQFVLDNGFRSVNSGTEAGAIPAASQKYGLKATAATSKADIIAALQANSGDAVQNLIILDGHDNDPSSPPTRSGHLYVIDHLSADGQVFVSDPNSQSKTLQAWDLDKLLAASSMQWILSRA